ncbi:MAG: metal-dependent transcriptional regulator [Elusimicrobia bacterium]|nr:metal-dependent transcriptional regulator [Elusimicrobiota bacterium]
MSETKVFRLPSAEEEARDEALAHLWIKEEEGLSCALSPADRERAGDVIRRLRLAERLLTDVLALGPAGVEEDACRLEHVLSAGTADAICTLLGHPRSCPHGHAIPGGACCASGRERCEALLKPLDALREGEGGRVAYLSAPDSPDAQRLLSLGLVPGAALILEQRRPAFVVRAGANTVAMEAAVAGGIIVRLGA